MNQQTTMELSVFLEQILFVIVLYRRTPEQSPTFAALLGLCKDSSTAVSVFVYDNSPLPYPLQHDHIIYRHDAKNSGVSKAYNEASVCAGRMKKKWMLFLDQDTFIDSGLLKRLLEATQHHENSVAFVPQLKDRRGLISPFRWMSGKGKRIHTPPPTLSLHRFRFINSGLLIRLDAFIEAGGYDETIPLDFSDIAFGEKLRRVTDHFIVADAVCLHSFSGTSDLSHPEASSRFHFFCLGSFRMGKVFGFSRILFMRALLRSVLLSIRYKRIRYLKIFIKHALA